MFITIYLYTVDGIHLVATQLAALLACLDLVHHFLHAHSHEAELSAAATTIHLGVKYNGGVAAIIVGLFWSLFA